MPRTTSRGECGLCGKTFAKGSMTTHLKACMRKANTVAPSPDTSESQGPSTLHIVVEGYNIVPYWMHLQGPANATLQDLDNFLKRIWLECCGHLSAFNIAGEIYFSNPWGGLDQETDDMDKDMEVELGRLLRPGLKFDYEYDFGSTTWLDLRVVSEARAPDQSIRVLARNSPPPFTCRVCGAVATQVCTECNWEDELQGLLCGKCLPAHGCDEAMQLPVVNSPRCGVCAYTG